MPSVLKDSLSHQLAPIVDHIAKTQGLSHLRRLKQGGIYHPVSSQKTPPQHIILWWLDPEGPDYYGPGLALDAQGNIWLVSTHRTREPSPFEPSAWRSIEPWTMASLDYPKDKVLDIIRRTVQKIS